MASEFFVYSVSFICFVVLSFVLLQKKVNVFLEDRSSKITDFFKLTTYVKQSSIKFFLEEDEKRKHIDNEIEKIKEDTRLKLQKMQREMKDELKEKIKHWEETYQEYLEKSSNSFREEIVNEVTDLIIKEIFNNFKDSVEGPSQELAHQVKKYL